MAVQAPVAGKHYICIYPAYINSRKTLAEGRRIAKSKCVENPTVNEMKDVCAAAGLKVVPENKLYPREMFRGDVSVRGRVRVQLKNEKNELMSDQFKNKMSLMIYLGEMIPKLKSRIQKTGGAEQVQQKGKKNQKKRR
ncbi:signal recognition particle 19 kDa protein-like [Styela clava]|uniref:signal recognition particle 19 kDa protein-like n=1 Tax=Styela clava TaxID=7725 RepID=UPI00193956F0|nr:signal recognition particle 19 kDa protein-like [Styela clava]